MERIIELYNNKREEEGMMIKKALDNGLGMLHINDFVKVTGFELNEILPIDMMWDTFHKGIPIYISDKLIEIFGYKGELKKQKDNLLNLVKKYNIPVIQLNNNEYEKFSCPLERTSELSINQDNFNISDFYPKLIKSAKKGRTLHNLIMPNDFKKLFLVVNTEKGNLAREFMVKLDELFHLYMTYQTQYEKNIRVITESYFKDEKNRHAETMQKHEEAMQKHEETLEKLDRVLLENSDIKESLEVTQEVLTEMNSKFDKSTDERAPRTKDSSKHETFVVLRISKSQYYIVRCQGNVIKRTLKTLKIKYPQMITLIEITYQPNSKNLYNLMKEHLNSKIIVKRNIVELKENYTEKQFIQDINEINRLKKDVETDEECAGDSFETDFYT